MRWGLNEIELRDPNTPVVFRNGGRTLVVAVIGDPQKPTPGQPVTPPPNAPAASEPSSRNETAAAMSPSGPPSATPTEERNPMPASTTTPRTPPVDGEAETSPSALRAALDHVESIRGSLRDLLTQVNETATVLKAAEKEKRATEQEIEAVRRTLRGLQRVQL